MTAAETIQAAIPERVLAAIWAADVSRSAVEHDWPECHKPHCQGSHPTADLAFATMKARIAEAVSDELDYRAVSRPVFYGFDGPAEQAAVTLAVLMDTYFDKTGRFIKAAELIIEAYPALAAAFLGDPQ